MRCWTGWPTQSAPPNSEKPRRMMNSGSNTRLGEFELIAELFAPLATAPGALHLKDDAAIATPPTGHDLVLTADALIESVHFFANDPPELIAKKALRVNLSDL